jgi:N-acetylmuramoyl-L-alanine amidase
MTDQDAIAQLSDEDVFALTLFGEVRGEPDAGKRAVAHVIRNRVRANRRGFGLGYGGVCLKPWQFSCWKPEGGLANYERVLDVARQVARPEFTPGPQLRRCYEIARETMREDVPDLVSGANHYLTAALLRKAPPKWAQGQLPVATVGSHVFFRLAVLLLLLTVPAFAQDGGEKATGLPVASLGRLVPAPVGTRAESPVTVAAWPRLSPAPAHLTVTVRVQPAAENRALRVDVVGDAYEANSLRELEGAEAPRRHQLFWEHLPAGRYTVTATLITTVGRRVATDSFVVTGPEGLGEEGS